MNGIDGMSIDEQMLYHADAWRKAQRVFDRIRKASFRASMYALAVLLIAYVSTMILGVVFVALVADGGHSVLNAVLLVLVCILGSALAAYILRRANWPTKESTAAAIKAGRAEYLDQAMARYMALRAPWFSQSGDRQWRSSTIAEYTAYWGKPPTGGRSVSYKLDGDTFSVYESGNARNVFVNTPDATEAWRVATEADK